MIKPLVVAVVRLLAGAMLVLGGFASIVGSGGGGGGGGPEARLEIVSQPQDQSVFEGRSATFTVGANNATRYRWQFSVSGGAAWSDVEGATGPSVTVVAGAGDDGRQVRVIVEGAATSCAATSRAVAAAGARRRHGPRSCRTPR